MKQKELRFEIEELEERIAPHCSAGEILGGGNAAVGFDVDHGGQLCLPDGDNAGDLPLPAQAASGMIRASLGGN